MRFDTQAVHGGYEPDAQTHSRAVPVYMTNAYTFDSTEHARSLFMLEQPGNIYTRLQNPTTTVLEERVNLLEGGVGAMAASGGHGAIIMTLMNLAQAGDEIVAMSAIYGGAINLMSKTLKNMGITVHFVDANDPESFQRATNERTKAYFAESIGNPLADIPDIAAIAEVAHRNGIPLIVDNTVATPFLVKPIELGADIVIHSATKFMCGNGAAMGGVVVDSGNFKWLHNPRFPEFNTPDSSYKGLVYAEALGRTAFITKLRAHILRDVGAVISPFNSWVILLGLETLPLRMARHCENAQKVAEFLEAHPAVERVYYPGLKSSKYYELAKKQNPKGSGSVYAFDLRGGREAAAKFCDSLKLLTIVANLGDSRSIVSCPSTTTHSQLSDEQLRAINIQPGTIRISVGIEDVADILDDIKQAMDKI